LIYLGTDTSVSGRVSIVGNASNLEHELANGYNSGDEYTGRTENDMTLAAWEEVSIIKANIYKYKYNVLSNRLCSICLRQSRETNGLRSALRKKDLC